MSYQETIAVDQSVVMLVDQLLIHAIVSHASDIHLEPEKDYLRVRFRVDGLLYDQNPIAHYQMFQVISRLKVLGGMDIAQKRIPQDGMLQFHHDNRAVDIRLSTFPALGGEKMVVRILDRLTQALSIDQLGFMPSMLKEFNSLIARPAGLLLVTGPTGSGKTTTLYAALCHLHAPEKNIVTLEDPVEYHINGVTQGQINGAAGFTFDKGIRSVLRQDPDILMVGEIRDSQTARTAIEAALTGHLVLSTMHTEDAPSAIMRLMDMGIEPYLISAAVVGVVAQRLVRKICVSCSQEQKNLGALAEFAKKYACENVPVYTGSGCSACIDRGHKGRMGIFQVLTMTDTIRSAITHAPDKQVIERKAQDNGMQTLVHDGRHKVLAGDVSLEELARVLL